MVEEPRPARTKPRLLVVYLRYGFNPRLPPYGFLPFSLTSCLGMRAP